MDPVLALGALCVLFVGTHLLLSHPPIREPLVARLGLGRFRGAYSLLSIVIWLPLAWLWWTNRHAGAALFVVRTPVAVRLAELVAAVGIGMVVAGFAVPPPNSMESKVKGDHFDVRGMSHVTRHPVMLGTVLLCLAHMPTNGWTADLWFWGSHLVLALLGAVHQDQRLIRSRPGYADYLARTTFLPNPLGLPRIGLRGGVAFAAGAGLAFGIRWLHPWF